MSSLHFGFENVTMWGDRRFAFSPKKRTLWPRTVKRKAKRAEGGQKKNERKEELTLSKPPTFSTS